MTTNAIRRRTTEESGFTLVELLVVMIIVSILMAVAMPAFLGNKQKAVATNIKTGVTNVSDNIEACSASFTNGQYMESNGAVPPTLTFCADASVINGSDKGLTSVLNNTSYSIKQTATAAISSSIPANGKVLSGSLCDSGSAPTACEGYWVLGTVDKGSERVVFSLVKSPSNNQVIKSCGGSATSGTAVALSNTDWRVPHTVNDLSRQICPSQVW